MTKRFKHKGNMWFSLKKKKLTCSASRVEAAHSFTCVPLCADPLAKVLTIRDEEENAFVREKLLPLRDLAQFVWLGLHKDNASELHSWPLGLRQLPLWPLWQLSVTCSTRRISASLLLVLYPSQCLPLTFPHWFN